MNEYDALDAMAERMAREEQDSVDREQGQFILDVMAEQERRKQAGDPLIETLQRAHQAKAEADER